jgi:hypothetical protein
MAHFRLYYTPLSKIRERKVIGRKSVWNHPNKEVFWVFKSEGILPLSTPSKKLRFE